MNYRLFMLKVTEATLVVLVICYSSCQSEPQSAQQSQSNDEPQSNIFSYRVVYSSYDEAKKSNPQLGLNRDSTIIDTFKQ